MSLREQNERPAMPEPGPYQLNKNVHNITRYQTIAADMQHPSTRPRLYDHMDLIAMYAPVEQLCYNVYGMPLEGGEVGRHDGTGRVNAPTSQQSARERSASTGRGR